MLLKYPIEYVVWEDHYSQDAWTEIEQFDNKAATVISVGYLVKEDDKALTLALNICNGSEVSCAMIIMKNCITDRKRIKNVGAARIKVPVLGPKPERTSPRKDGDGSGS